MDTEKKHLTTAQLADRWQMSQETLRGWRFRGIGPKYFKPGGKYGKALYCLEDIKAHEQQNTGGGSR